MEYDTYVFDLDGTLLNTLGDLAASCNYALRQSHMPERTIDEVRRFVGNGVKKLMERAVPCGLDNPLFDATYATFRQHYLVHSLDTTLPYPGIMETLNKLSSQGKQMAVVSNKFYAATQELCRHFFGDYIKVAIGERENIRNRPDTVLEALHQLGVSKEGAVYRHSDVDPTRPATVVCLASACCGIPRQTVSAEHGATTLISQPEEPQLNNCPTQRADSR